MRLLPVAVLAVLAAAACSKKSPTQPDTSAGPIVVEGQTVSATDGSPTPNLSIRIGDQTATSDTSGSFRVELPGAGTYTAIVRGTGVVDRETRIAGPKEAPTKLSLIPSSFDLSAFDTVFRSLGSRLARWTTRPSLVVVASVMEYRSTADTFDVLTEQLTDDEVSQIAAHATEGLATLTGNTYTSFAAVSIERPAAGTRLDPIRPGFIVVGRYSGIARLAGAIGYGQWMEQSDGSIASGAMLLDRDFDRGDPRRRLLRIHELGHALGYQHVESRTSIMNPAIGADVNDFDRAGALIAFQRPVGNRSPDVDPITTTVALASGEGRVSRSTVCRARD
jgi:hypothetical protein